jgi:hypothetical protein
LKARLASGLKLYTNAFTIEELNLLIEALNNFKNLLNIKATINISTREKLGILYISQKPIAVD